MTAAHWSMKLIELDTCSPAVTWAAAQTTYAEAWENCERGDWLLWLAGRLEVDQKLLVKAGCACARTALQYVPKGEERPRIAIETAEAWAEGRATLSQVRAAAAAAAAWAASASASAWAAWAASASAAASTAAAEASAASREHAALVRAIIARPRLP
jgi:hypothetical protein